MPSSPPDILIGSPPTHSNTFKIPSRTQIHELMRGYLRILWRTAKQCNLKTDPNIFPVTIGPVAPSPLPFFFWLASYHNPKSQEIELKNCSEDVLYLFPFKICSQDCLRVDGTLTPAEIFMFITTLPMAPTSVFCHVIMLEAVPSFFLWEAIIPCPTSSGVDWEI